MGQDCGSSDTLEADIPERSISDAIKRKGIDLVKRLCDPYENARRLDTVAASAVTTQKTTDDDVPTNTESPDEEDLASPGRGPLPSDNDDDVVSISEINTDDLDDNPYDEGSIPMQIAMCTHTGQRQHASLLAQQEHYRRSRDHTIISDEALYRVLHHWKCDKNYFRKNITPSGDDSVSSDLFGMTRARGYPFVWGSPPARRTTHQWLLYATSG